MRTRNAFVAMVLTLAAVTGRAQSTGEGQPPKFEVGPYFTVLHINRLQENPFGVGARASYNFSKYLSFDMEGAHFPQNPSGNFGETQLLAGVKAGIRQERFGVFAKLRPGLVNFGGRDFTARNGPQTYFAMDVGAVIEYYPSRHLSIRLDMGDTVVNFGGPTRSGASLSPTPPGLTHNWQGGVGLMVRF